jgi:hypothetical protein
MELFSYILFQFEWTQFNWLIRAPEGEKKRCQDQKKKKRKKKKKKKGKRKNWSNNGEKKYKFHGCKDPWISMKFQVQKHEITPRPIIINTSKLGIKRKSQN